MWVILRDVSLSGKDYRRMLVGHCEFFHKPRPKRHFHTCPYFPYGQKKLGTSLIIYIYYRVLGTSCQWISGIFCHNFWMQRQYIACV